MAFHQKENPLFSNDLQRPALFICTKTLNFLARYEPSMLQNSTVSDTSRQNPAVLRSSNKSAVCAVHAAFTASRSRVSATPADRRCARTRCDPEPPPGWRPSRAGRGPLWCAYRCRSNDIGDAGTCLRQYALRPVMSTHVQKFFASHAPSRTHPARRPIGRPLGYRPRPTSVPIFRARQNRQL